MYKVCVKIQFFVCQSHRPEKNSLPTDYFFAIDQYFLLSKFLFKKKKGNLKFLSIHDESISKKSF